MTFSIKKINYAKLASEAKAHGASSIAVCGIISRDEKFLLIKRAPEKHRGGHWEIPGGKVEKGESLNAALAREVREETNLRLKEVKSYVGHVDYSPNPRRKVRLFMFDITADDSEVCPNPTEHTEYMWATVEEAKKVLNPDGFTSIFLSYINSR
ncbi:MAG: NUDIX domain-containing protein [Candidatus Micrarchaeota archaeon]|nr:NUDIX domain-containing protein [Candidatus Micrarchaeota archaeon]